MAVSPSQPQRKFAEPGSPVSVPSSQVAVVDYQTQTHESTAQPSGGLVLFEALSNVGTDFDRVRAAASVTQLVADRKTRDSRTLNGEQRTSERNTTQPSTAFLLDAQAADYGDCPWEIVMSPHGGVDENSVPVTDGWVDDVLGSLASDDEAIGDSKRRLWWLHHVHGQSVAGLRPSDTTALGLETVWASIDSTTWEKDRGLRFGTASDPKSFVLSPGPGGKLPAWDLVSSHAKSPGSPYSIMQALEPLYHLWWLLVRGMISTAESAAIMNGLLFLPRADGEPGLRSSTAGAPVSDETQAVYNMMRLRSPIATATDQQSTQHITDGTMATWKWPDRHTSRLPIPHFGKPNEKPELVDIARKFSPEEQSMLVLIETRLALGWNAPASMFLGSIGDAKMNQFNAWSETDQYRKSVERGGRPIDAAATRSVFWGILERTGIDNHRQYHLRSNYARLRPPPAPDQIVWANDNLGVDRAWVARALSIPEEALLEGADLAAWQASRLRPVVIAPSVGQDPPPSPNPAPGPQDPNPTEPGDPQQPPTSGPDRQKAASNRAVLNRRVQALTKTIHVTVHVAIDTEYQRAAHQIAVALNKQAAAINLDTVIETALVGLSLRLKPRLKAIITKLIALLSNETGVTESVIRAAIKQGTGLTIDALATGGVNTAETLLTQRLVQAIEGAVDTQIIDDVTQAATAAENETDEKVPFLDARKIVLATMGHAVNSSITSTTTPAVSWLETDTATFALDATGLQLSDQRIWIYGDAARVTFDPHFDLDQTVFTGDDDDQLLITDPQYDWLNRTHFAVGDHGGCECDDPPLIE
jgi:hypothetical protein